MRDFDAYLERIGLGGAGLATWQAIHRAHVTSIPFENLDPHRGIAVSLDQEDLERKLVAQRRGGYCFEHNMLFASALEHLGLSVEPMLARTRSKGTAPDRRPATHLVLRVSDGAGSAWHADVGFGLGTLLDPIPFGADPDRVHEQSGWSFRVVEEDSNLVLQTLGETGWSDLYAFAPRPVPRIDIEVGNWWTSTNPRSPFVFGLIAAVNHADGSREVISDWGGPLEVRTMVPERTEISEQPRSVIPAKLEQFGLPGFTLGEDQRVR
ncbi:MAG TPA: arylamine N-acetyltransferase [Solirubrobacteraceae bacterium]|nr:arylamine N-acetyltransferase [Solirubrobacteraceae bacterium]